ncbi:MAG TPA: alpha/beta hydrolase [Candidatus Binatia bacterium]|jgi:acetyl esterase/lipase|nr:alpha/beta hydrolase [Candidatus Binatia bacterium]
MASPQLQMAIEAFKTIGEEMAKAPDMKSMRAVMEKMAAPAPADVKCTAVNAGGVPAEWVVAPGAAADRFLLYLHGGGYVMGSINTHREMVSRLSRAAGVRALALDYRLAPENPFPAAVNDATAAYRWLLSQDAKPERTVIAGDSAGGGLALATLVAIRDAKLPLPAAGVCLSPWADMEGVGASMTSKAKEDPVVQKEMLLNMAKLYLGGADPKTPLAAPLHADLRGLPPLLIQVGSAETLLDDASRVTERAKAAGVKVDLEVWNEMIHVWQLFAPILPEGQEAIEKIGKFIRGHTA